LIDVDDAFRMRVDLLEAAVEADVAAGLVPFCVIPTVGTTSVASIDPVRAVLEVGRRHGMWVHVDCAYGGSAAVDARYQGLLDGVDAADSFVVNPHKWLFVPMDLSVLYCRNKEWLRDAFSLVPEYLRTAGDERALNYHEYGVPLGRRFRALKLWFTMRAFGRDKVAALIHQQIEDAKWMAEKIAAHPDYEVCAPVEFSLVVFRHRGGDAVNERLLEAMNETGEVLLSPNVLRGQKVIRLAVGNIQTSREDLQMVWALMLEKAAELG
jgi:aromatic-L-amino-acid decarboxylase